jgi:hypothetical protein
MKRSSFIIHTWLHALMLASAVLAQGTGNAGEALITARVDKGAIVNTTPLAMFCNQVVYNYCTRTMWSVDLPITYSKSIDLSSANERAKAYVQMPARQQLTLQNRSTGQTLPMFLSFTQISQHVTHQTQPVIGRNALGGCSSFTSQGGSTSFVQFIWYLRTPNSPTPCTTDAGSGDGTVQESRFTRAGVVFRPEFPPVDSLSPGLWEGFIDYPLLAGRGFDFGEISDASTNSIRFRVQLRVMHDIRVDLPAANGEVVLNPPGGWQSYLMTNKVPERLYHNAPLRIWTNGPFTVYLICQFTSNARCAMRHPTRIEYLPVTTALTLPGPFRDGPLPVERTRLYIGEANATLITHGGDLSNQPGMLHFDVPGSYLINMIRYRGTKYSGNITIVFDANP